MDLRKRHAAIWAALDELAHGLDMAPSRLAITAGLDQTAFNRSKRTDGERLRWPTMETLSIVLMTTGTPYADFFAYVDELVGRDELPARKAHPRHRRKA